MPISLKYAVVERERRFLVASVPEGVNSTQDILDRYVIRTRLRLREVTDRDGTVTRKLGHKVLLTEGPAIVACTRTARSSPRSTTATNPRRSSPTGSTSSMT